MAVHFWRCAAGVALFAILACGGAGDGGEKSAAGAKDNQKGDQLKHNRYSDILIPLPGAMNVPLKDGKICVQVEAYDGPVGGIKYPTEVRVKIYNAAPALPPTPPTDARNAAPKWTAGGTWISFIELDANPPMTSGNNYWLGVWVKYASASTSWELKGPNMFKTVDATGPLQCDNVGKAGKGK